MYEVKAVMYNGKRIVFLDLNFGTSTARLVSVNQHDQAWTDGEYGAAARRIIPQLEGSYLRFWGFGETLSNATSATWGEVEDFINTYPTLRGLICHNGKIKCCF